MLDVIRWMISPSGLISGGALVLASCLVVAARVVYIEKQLAPETPAVVVATDEWLPPVQPDEPLAAPARQSRPKTLDEWLAWDYLSDSAADLYEDSKAIEQIYGTMAAAQVARCQWGIARLGSTESALKEDTAEHRLAELRKEMAEIRADAAPAAV